MILFFDKFYQSRGTYCNLLLKDIVRKKSTVLSDNCMSPTYSICQIKTLGSIFQSSDNFILDYKVQKQNHFFHIQHKH